MAKPKQIHGRFYGTGKRKTAVARVFLSDTGRAARNEACFAVTNVPRDPS